MVFGVITVQYLKVNTGAILANPLNGVILAAVAAAAAAALAALIKRNRGKKHPRVN